MNNQPDYMDIPMYLRCPVCTWKKRYPCSVVPPLYGVNENKIYPYMPIVQEEICDKCFEKGWRFSISGDIVRVQCYYDSTNPNFVTDIEVVERLGGWSVI